MMKYAIDYVHGNDTHTLVVDAADRDDAYGLARDALIKAKFYSAALQGACRVAGQADIDKHSKGNV